MQAPLQPKQETKEEEDVKFFDEPNNEIFRQVRYEVPENSRSGGLLGLDVPRHTIGDYAYEV